MPSNEKSLTQLSLVIPIYNERDNLLPLLDEIQKTMDKLPLVRDAYEIVAVDDGSQDGSGQILRDLARGHPQLKVILFRKNQGQSAALDAGFQHASGTRIVSLDADLQNDPADIAALLAKLDEGYDVVTGWRKVRQDGFWLRRLPSQIANALIRRIMQSQVHDLGCTLRAYRREILSVCRIYGEMHRLLCPILEMHGARIAELAVHHRPPRSGLSKYGLDRTVKVWLDLIFLWFQRNYLTRPMYIFGGFGSLSI